MHRLFAWVHVLVMLSVGAVVVLSRLSEADETLLDRSTSESGPFEIGSVVVLLGIGAASGWILFKLRRHRGAGSRWQGAFYVSVAAGALLAALEELSWGQHLLGFEPHRVFNQHNHQEETNLHNLVPAPLFGFLVNASIYVLFVFLPLLAHWTPGSAWLRRFRLTGVLWSVPSLHCILIFCFGFSLQAYFVRETTLDTLALMLGLLSLGWLIHMPRRGSRPLVKLHLYLVAALTLLFMSCYQVFSYENVQYEIREFVFMYGFLFWLIDHGHASLSASDERGLLFVGGRD